MKHRLLFLILAAPVVFSAIQRTRSVSFVKAAKKSGDKIESPPEKASVASKAVTQDKVGAASLRQEAEQDVAFDLPIAIKGAVPDDPIQSVTPGNLSG